MIVCICKRVTERQLAEAIAEGASSVKALSRQTGCGSQCGRCIPTVREMLSIECRPADAMELPQPGLRRRPAEVRLPTLASA